jgi:hypothetical protein
MTDRRSGAQRGWPKGATAQMGLPSKWSGAVWRGRQPEPTPSFTKSLLQFPPLSSRGHPPVAIHCEPRTESTNPDTQTSRHDRLPRQTIVLLAMTECVVIARAKPVAIHCEPISEPTKPERFTSRHDGLPRPFVPRNDNVVSQNTTDISSPLRVLARAQPVAIHCTPTSEPTNPERNSC